MPVYNLNERFKESVKRFPDRVAIESKITYSRLDRKVRSMAYFISSLGIEKSDRVAIILQNCPEWAVIFFAVSYTGAVAVPLDAQLPHKEIENILSDSGARMAFISKENQRLSEFLQGIERGGNVTVACVEEIKESEPPERFKPADIEPDDLMAILYTSGTTDVPKGVMLTHKNLCANFHSLSKLKLFSYKDVVLSILPLYHSYPMMTTLILPLLSGAKIVYVPGDWPEKLADYLKEARISVFIGVPQIFYTMHMRMMKRLNALPIFSRLCVQLAAALHLTKVLLPGLRNAFGKNLRFFACGGAKLDSTVTKDFLMLGFKILEGYGLTETSPVVSFNPLRRPKIGSVGPPIPDVKVRVVDKDSGGVGQIAIQGPNVMKGYYKDEEKTRSAIRDNWFLSGDLGYMDKDGYIFITGRSKEVIVLSSGKNIYPEEIESYYSSIPFIKEMCVIGVLKEKGRANIEYLHAIVVPDFELLRERGEINVRKVIGNNLENLSRELPLYRRITGWTVSHESLPRTVLGKIKRHEVHKKFLPVILNQQRREEPLLPEEQCLYESDLTKRLIECLKDVLAIKGDIHLNDSFELDLGLDSLARVELVLAVERCFNIDLPDEMAASGIFTVKDLLLKVEELLKKGHRKGLPYEERPVSWPEILNLPLSPDFQKKILLKPGWLDYILTFLVKGFVNLFFRIFYNLRVEGAQRPAKEGPYILCVNHVSFFDGFIVTAGVRFRTQLDLFFIGFRRYFMVPIVRDLVKRGRIIPIDATQIIEAMQASKFILKHKKALCIFPEGERSIDGEVQEFRKGIGIIARELDIPLVPVLIEGAFEAWPRTQRFPRLHPIRIRFGNPVQPSELIKIGMGLGAQDEYEAISKGIREELVKLKKL